jgi:hypothetical protein
MNWIATLLVVISALMLYGLYGIFHCLTYLNAINVTLHQLLNAFENFHKEYGEWERDKDNAWERDMQKPQQ